MVAMIEISPEGILDFWLGPLRGGMQATSEENWRERMLRWRVGVFARAFEDQAFSDAQRELYEALHLRGSARFFAPAAAWDTPRGWLARLIVLDQFPRCVHRGTPLAYASDEETVPMLRHICAQGWDRSEYDELERMWVYVALSHPEDTGLQELSVTKWTEWGRDLVDASPPKQRRVNQRVAWYFIKSIVEHSEAVLLHGKFPHRNPILCRPHRAGEVHYLTSELRPLWSFTQPPRPLFYALHAAMHATQPGLDCRGLDADALAHFERAIGLSDPLSLGDVFDVLGKPRVDFRELYRHVCLDQSAPVLSAIEISAGFVPHLRKVTHAIFKDETAAWPPRSAKASVPRVIDVPALNLAIGCQYLGAGDVRIARAAIDGFVTTTRFTPRPITELFARYRTLLAGSESSFETTRDGVRRSLPIGPKQFRELAGTLFAEGPAREQVLATLYELLDLDYDGTVDAGELLVALNALCSGGLEAKLDVCFDVFDRDGSGRLDREELWDLLHTTLLRGLNLVEALFLQYLPEDHPADTEQLVLFSLADFSAIEQAAVRALSEADADADGSVDRAEFHAWAARHPLLGQLFRLSDGLFGVA
jgi:uncharacterized protein (DUF924 family)/Ca2+-binding EF-hand superfamily protein